MAWVSPNALGRSREGTFDVKPGSLFPALHRLEQEGFIRGDGPQRRKAMRQVLPVDGCWSATAQREKKNWARVAAAVAQVLEVD